MIRVVIADDQSVIRDGLKFIIEQDKDIKVVGCAKDGEEALQFCEALSPDLILMDIVMPRCNGVEATKLIKEKYHSTKVIILTTFKDDANISAALRNGAEGYVLKDIESDELILTIKSVAKGLRVIQENAFDTVLKQFNSNAEIKQMTFEQVEADLTQREIEVVRLIVYGKSNKEIATALFMGEGTVRNMISVILAKMKIKDRTQLAVYAVKNNII